MTDYPVIHGTDTDDVEILSARFQDALVRPSELIYQKGKRLFVVLANRFMWERKPKGLFSKRYFRIRSGLHFNHVLDIKTRGLAQAQEAGEHDQHGILNLLAITVLPVDATDPENPECFVSLHFAGNATVRLHVECVEASSRDMGDPWTTLHRPEHETVA
jgi:hypothetical protein